MATPPYPCPSEVNVVDGVPIKLCPSTYSFWKHLMLNFIESHGLVGFVDGTIRTPPQPPEEQQDQEDHYRSWKRSDDLVKSWIFATVREDILPQLVLMQNNTARELWIAIERGSTRIFERDQQIIDSINKKVKDANRGKDLGRYLPLHKAVVSADWDTAAKFLDQEPEAVHAAITRSSETALILAVRTARRNHFVKKLMEEMSSEDVAGQEKNGWTAQEKNGWTALHVAVNGGNIEAAKWLVERNPELANIEDKFGKYAVNVAADLGNREMVVYMLEVTKDDGDPNPFEDKAGLMLLFGLATSGLYDIALTFLQRHPKLASMEPTPLWVMAQMPSSFRSGTRLRSWQSLIYSGVPLKLEDTPNNHKGRDIDNHAKQGRSHDTASEVAKKYAVSQKLHEVFWDVAEKLVPPIKSVRETKLIHHQACKFVKGLCEELLKSDVSNAGRILGGPMLRAASIGIREFVEEILESFPAGIYLANEKNQSVFQLAIVYRRENVFNLIYQLEDNRYRFLSKEDSSMNNSLHLAGNLAPQQQLSLRACAAGAALQMQRELQWFKEVGKFMLPQMKERKNAGGKTPLDLFTETHKDLVKEGEKWMKDTANSCTIVAALIVTVVFAAAITVPGGTDGASGLPIFLKDQAFVLFLVSDALALFSSTTSLLMFLSMLTSRYGEQDFLYSLPRRLIIGLVTLFLSIITMMIAFGAILKILSGNKKAWIVITVAALSCVPVTLFALLQFPLLLEMIKSTYFPGMFRKHSDRLLY